MDSLVEEFIKDNLSIISGILETNQFNNLFTNLALNFQIADFKTNILKMELRFFLTSLVSPFGAPFGIPLFLALNVYNYLTFNSVRLADYFNDIRKNLDTCQRNYKNKIKNKKGEFIEELDSLQSISENEIDYLMGKNFIQILVN